MEVLLYAIILLAGLLLILLRPVARLTAIPVYWEIGTGSLLIIVFLFYLTGQFVTPRITEEDLAKRPCGSESPQGACYSLEQELCLKAWDNAESTCKTEISALVKDRPSALIGPALNRCKAKKMDRFLRYNRAHSDSPFCKAYFDFIEAR